MLELLKLAAKVAVPTYENDHRDFWLGCIGIRKDGVIVSAKNGAVSLDLNVISSRSPKNHAEGRALRKMSKGGVLYVARVKKGDHSLGMARPCFMCQTLIISRNIEKVFYTVNENQYGIWYPKSDIDKIYTCR